MFKVFDNDGIFVGIANSEAELVELIRNSKG